MPNRPMLMLSLFGSMALLGGCAQLSSQQQEPPPPVTAAQFESGIQRLESNLAARCENQSQLLSMQRMEQRTLTADVREVGSLLRGLRGDIAALDDNDDKQATQVVTECQAADDRLANKELLGRSEWIGLPNVGTYLQARVDSGADTSSLSAREITSFERDGEDWVRFKLGLDDDDSAVDTIRDSWVEAPVERRVRIEQATGEESRPVIKLLMTLGPIRETVEFTLTDRAHLDYPVLLGRHFLMDIAIIDVAEDFLHGRPDFPRGSESSDDADQTEDETP
ncbi:ATP-dependent zinc protease [Halomonas elongata]|uniref:ATP-dependent zinc protease family protein n=1 Tax=Halomonas elongata TaxID=2746 RepID=UPI000DCB1379|nr:ATP-dependent zinc protease [Halomonas elongata]MDL4862408.1 ATP-dependent zinc protease [Halomonas elongata]RAW07797.1 ATP-dependent zinc protease [Halomonas elongata]